MPAKKDSKKKKGNAKKAKVKKQKISEKEYAAKVVELAKSGITAEKIGEKLRKEGIHPREHKKKISKILKENKLYEIPDIRNIELKLKKLIAHAEKNKQDKRAKREVVRISSKLRKLKKYHKLQ